MIYLQDEFSMDGNGLSFRQSTAGNHDCRPWNPIGTCLPCGGFTSGGHWS